MKTEALQKDKKLPLAEKSSYWSFLIGQNFSYTMVCSFLGAYMMMSGVDVNKTAALMLIVKIWDAVNDALFGVIFDKIKFKSGNKCLPWLRISAAAIPITTLLLFVIPNGSPETVKLAWFTVAYILWDTAYTVSDVPIYSMVTTMTNQMNERNQLMSVGRIFGAGGGGLASMVISVLISEKVGLNFGWTAVIICLLSAAFMVPISLLGKERNKPEGAEEGYTLRQMFSYLKTNRCLIQIFSSYIIFSSLATTSVLNLFVSYYLFGSALFSTLMTAVLAVPMLLMALLMPLLLKKVDKFQLYFWCIAASTLMSFVIYFAGYQSPTLYIVLRIVQSFPLSIAGVASFMFTPDCAEYGQYKTGTDARGVTFAVQTFSAKISGAISSSLGMLLIGLFGWVTINAGSFAEIEAQHIAQPDSALKGLWFTYVLVPAIGGALALIPLLFYKLRDKDVQIMAKCNSGEITREEAERLLSRKY